MFYRISLLSLFAIFACIAISHAQGVSISPTMVFVGEKQPFGSHLVLNGTDQTQEVTIEFLFGYPDVKSGSMQMIYDNENMEQKYSITDAVRAFPRSFTLAPQQRQIVRIRVQPNSELEDGIYWTRIKTTSNPQSPPIGTEVEDEVTASINFEVEQITTILFKKGNLTTGLEIDRFAVDTAAQHVIITTGVNRMGNSPYMGSLTVTVKDREGDVVWQERSNIAVYFNYLSTMSVALNRFSKGTYTAEVTFITERSDVASQNLVQAPKVSRTITFDIR